MKLKPYYVYELIDPRTNLPFYIGKGTGNRINHHEKEARQGVAHPKCEVINDIKANGLEVVKNIIKYFVDEEDAYKFERKHIDKIGLDKLTNLAKGGRSIFPFKPNTSALHNDQELISVIASLIRKTELLFAQGKTQLFFKFCGVEHPVSKESLKKVIDNISKPLERNGKSWVEKEFKKHNIIIDIVSKVENYGY